MSGTESDGDGGGRQPWEVRALYSALYHKPPSEGAWSYLASLIDRFGEARVCTALRKEHAFNPSPRNLISRMQKGLETGDQIRRLEAVQ
jgi:hypothetical protein